MDEINCEIAHQDIMASGYRKWKCLEALKQESQSIEKIDSLGFFEKVVFVHQCKFASPIREAMHEKYYRQPILFRWLCNSEWLKETLCKHNLHLRYVSRLESIP